MTERFTNIRFFMALLTVFAVLAKPFIPPRTLLLHPIEQNTLSIYGPKDAAGNPGTRWIDQSRASWHCDYVKQPNQGDCGISINWFPVDIVTNDDKAMAACKFHSSDPDGDGWGWENETSCRVTGITQHDEPAAQARCDESKSQPQNQDSSQHCHEHTTAPSTTAKTTATPTTTTTTTTSTTPTPTTSTTTKPINPQANALVPNSIDADAYDGFHVSLDYKGPATFINIYIRSKGQAQANSKAVEKSLSARMRTEALAQGPVFVGFNAFSMDEWWVFHKNLPREKPGSEFRDIIQVGLHYPEQGVHQMTIKEIKLVGKRITDEHFMLAIIFSWFIYLLLEASIKYVLLTRSVKLNQQQLQQLAGDTLELESEKDSLRNRVTTDPLTGINNRNGLTERLNELGMQTGLNTGCGVVVLDIDHFKTINDTYGHDAGDSVLKNFAHQIEQAVRQCDIFARWGGEEFVLIVAPMPPDQLRFMCEKLRRLIADSSLLANKEHQVTVSIGVTAAHSNETFDAVFKRADTALYRAKIQRNSVVYAN